MAPAATPGPLTGRRILVVRPAAQAAAAGDLLRRAGAVAVLVPLIELAPPTDRGAALAAAAARLEDYDWLVLTSANGAERLLAARGPAAPPAGLGIAAIGPATAAVADAGGLAVSLLPVRYVAESLLEAFPPPGRPGEGRVLLVRAEVAREVLPEGLRALGWRTDVVAAYRALLRSVTPAERAAVAGCDTVVFTSPSVVDAFCDQPEPLAVPATAAAIGPVTAAAVRRRGLTVTVEASEHTVAGLVAALAEHAAASPSAP